MEGDGVATAAIESPVVRQELAPVRPGSRIGSVDVLRGFALFGILTMNIYAFSLPFQAYTNPFHGGGLGRLDLGTWWATHLFSEMKFMSIFSMLFGAGLALMAERAGPGDGKFGGIFYRRLLWLLVFGMIHGYLMWFGDILYWYAVCGVILYPLRRWSPRRLAIVGTALLAASIPIMLSFGFFALPMIREQATEALAARDAGEELTEEQEAAIEGYASFFPTPEKIQEEVDAYRGGYLEQVVHRAPLVLQFQTVFMLVFGFWRIGGLMLLGMALMRWGVFSAERSNRFYALMTLFGYGLGLPLIWFGARQLMATEFDPVFLNQGGMLPNYWGSIVVAFGHVGVVMLICRAGVLRALTDRLAAVGRMALTNYLTHTVICTTIFYGWGFGRFDHHGRFSMMGFVVAIWLFQLLVSKPWLERFRFGPVEWLWRSLTYWKRQPMRVRPGLTPA